MATSRHGRSVSTGVTTNLVEPVGSFSGIPLLEQKADSRWGGQDDYEAYKASTPVLVLKPPKAA